MQTHTNNIVDQIKKVLEEDLGPGDITAQLIDPKEVLDVHLICRENAVLCGCEWFTQTFLMLDSDVSIEWLFEDGNQVPENTIVCRIKGNARSILSAERTALNFLQTLSATATVTHRYQSLIATTKCRILDTRKTIPGLRHAQKYAVTCGGGSNHRIGLFDAYLLKENHLAAAGGIKPATRQARELNPDALLEVEVETLAQLQEAIDVGVDRVLLDNFTIEQLQEAVALTDQRVELEASGDITEANILEVAQTGVDFISIGALTKHVRAIDFSLRYVD
jgi:nicotinate-nucleotide pyrophosphorylase (carboxylating)